MKKGQANFTYLILKLVTIAMSLEKLEKNHTHTSINPENFVNIGPVHPEIIGLQGVHQK